MPLVHIPSPSTVLVKEQGLMLQNVSATLVRVIQSHPTGALYSDMDLLKRLEQDDSTSSDSCEPTHPCSSGASPDCSPQIETITVTTTGKSCRFHSQRAIHLRLALHPGSVLGFSHASSNSFEPGSTEHDLGGVQICESISQDTALHNIRFILAIRVMVRGQHGDNFDVVTRRLVKIVPGPPPSLMMPRDPESGASEKQSQSKTLLQESDSMAALFTHATEYDGYDDTTTRMEAMLSASAVQDVTLEEMSCTPVPNPDMLQESAPLVLGDEGITPPDYQQVPPNESECSIPEEELPDFHEAALYPPEPLPVTLPAWHTTSHYTGSPDENIPVEGLEPLTPTTGLPPSYIDSANSQDSMGDPSSEVLPPAYAPPPAPSDPAAASSVSSSSDPIFPPLYEA
ncbi:hypothetical protein MNAN1_002219 [Malassezia nana]|uniref:Uncharacterized protein n=1 Tax=Malassezia nana TaxID=180528 RepID=A0AAF0EKS6_9BASI|nr:hypothetical protein MNAN1_002219 [Malassezia nana]